MFPETEQTVSLEGDRMSSLFTLSICLIVGLLVSRPAKKLGLPTVTAYLVAGILLGPYCIGSLGIANLGFATSDHLRIQRHFSGWSGLYRLCYRQ